MSPRNIIQTAKEKGLDIIAITDHNSTRNVKTCMELGKKNNLFVIGGCEINTQEEVHCLAYFRDLQLLNEFQQYLDEHLPDIKNDTSLFGHQVAVDEFDKLFGKGSADRAIHVLRSRALLKKLVLTHDALDSVTEELYDILVEEEEKERRLA